MLSERDQEINDFYEEVLTHEADNRHFNRRISGSLRDMATLAVKYGIAPSIEEGKKIIIEFSRWKFESVVSATGIRETYPILGLGKFLGKEPRYTIYRKSLV